MAGDFDIGVAAAVVTDSCILLVQEAKGTYAGCWGLPKGHVESNESIENAVLRELHEETNITGDVSGFIGLRTTQTRQGVGLFLCYKISASNFDAKPQEDEISDLRFFTAEEFDSIEWVSAAMRGFAEVALKDSSLPLIDLSTESKRPYQLVFSDGRMTLSEEVVQ
ncbi:MAG: RNA pyrophosphohydrolase [Candidatus Poseidoniaceae archaeon]|nr:MAG: RNA pyrophosphohydrolase [Candidatus Poseidoniaceae archaeon]